MRTYIKLIFACLVILTGSSLANSTSQSVPNNREKRLQKYRIKKALGEKVISWLSDANDAAGAECDNLADSLLAQAEPGVWSYFIAAQVANLREKRDKAISILENVIGRYPDEKAPIGIHVPVKIVGWFWIGTIAKQSGDIAKAKNVYETILQNLENTKNLEGKGALQITCNLYLAEIESQHLKRKDLALARLEAIQHIKKPAGPLGVGYDIYKSWAAYQHTRISRGKTQATQELVAHPEMTLAPLSAVGQLKLCGLSGAPLTGCGGMDKRINIVTNILVDRTVKSTASSLERSFVRLGYGFDQQYKKNFTKAEKHYSALFEEDSYFSPVAGLLLAGCKKAQGKTAEADSILEQVRAKYPGYDSVVTELKESWNKSKNN